MLFHLSYRQEIDGVTDRVRTGDLAGHNRALCPLSYGHHTFWQGRLDSNQQPAESKSAALPLSYTPVAIWTCGREFHPRDPVLQTGASILCHRTK